MYSVFPKLLVWKWPVKTRVHYKRYIIVIRRIVKKKKNVSYQRHTMTDKLFENYSVLSRTIGVTVCREQFYSNDYPQVVFTSPSNIFSFGCVKCKPWWPVMIAAIKIKKKINPGNSLTDDKLKRVRKIGRRYNECVLFTFYTSLYFSYCVHTVVFLRRFYFVLYFIENI